MNWYKATVLYKPVGGAGASFCMILNMLHIRDPFSKLRNTYKEFRSESI